MGIFSYIKDVFSAATAGVGDFFSPELWTPFGGVAVREVSSKEKVTPYTALTLPVWFACLRNIAEDTSKIPFGLYKEVPGSRLKERQFGNPLDIILSIQPNPEMSAMAFWETLQGWACGWGNGYAEIERHPVTNQVVALWPIHPSRVRMCRINGEIIYEVRSNPFEGSGEFAIDQFTQDEIYHLHGIGGVGLEGYSMVRLAAESIGVGLAVQKFGASFFGNGTHIGGVLRHPESLSPEARANIRQSWMDIHSGAGNAHKPLILEEGMEWEQNTIPPEEAQFLGTLNWTVEDICRWWRMPPHKVQQLMRATFSNIESQALEYVGDCLMPWLVRREQEAKIKLLGVTSDLCAEHDVIELLRAAPTARADYYNKLFLMGSISPDEIRQQEGLNPIPNGDGNQYFVQMQLVPLDKARDMADSSMQAKSNPPALPGEPGKPAGTPPQKKEPGTLAFPILLDAAMRICRKETMAYQRAIERFKGRGSEAYDAWANIFYGELKEDFADYFMPAIAAFAPKKIPHLYSAAASITVAMMTERKTSAGGVSPESIARLVEDIINKGESA